MPMRAFVITLILLFLLAGTMRGGLMAAPDRLSAAVDAYAHGDLATSRNLLETLQQDQDTTGGRAAYLLGVVDLQQKRWPEAAAVFDQAAQTLPVLADHAIYYAATAQFKMGQFARAAEMFQRITTQFPSSTLRGLALFWRAESLWRAGSPEAPDAFHQYLEAFAGGRHAAQAWFEMGQALEQQGRWPDAAQAYRRVVWVFPSSPYAGPARAQLARLATGHRLPPDATPPAAFYMRAESARM